VNFDVGFPHTVNNISNHTFIVKCIKYAQCGLLHLKLSSYVAMWLRHVVMLLCIKTLLVQCSNSKCSYGPKKYVYLDVYVSVYEYTFLYNKTNQMHQFPKFTPAWNSTCFGQFLCPSSGVYSFVLGTGVCHTGLKAAFEQDQDVPSWSCSNPVFQHVWHTPLPSVQWIKSWWWAEELPETCRISCRSKFGKLVYLVGFIVKKSVTMQVTWK